MKVVKVYGALRKRLGQCRFEFDVITPAQAIKALCVNFPGLDKWLIDSEQDGVSYRVAVSKEKATEGNVAPLLMPFGTAEVFSITPVIAGAGGGFGQTLFGAALIGLSFVSFGATGLFAGGTGLGTSATGLVGAAGIYKAGAFGSAALGLIGASLVLNGVAQMISPQPDFGSFDESAQLESFFFSNVVNTSKQGLPVPVAYGRVIVGSAVISSGLDVDQQTV
tara:strand:- start:293 stop:958 length:666 start_codon:yes stop_codon:yes gene_type:complete